MSTFAWLPKRGVLGGAALLACAPLLVRVVLSACASEPELAAAAPFPVFATPAPTATLSAAPTPAPAWDAASALSTPVSFEASRRPLPQLLGEMGREARVELSARAPSLVRACVTARAQALPLRQAMRSLARLYASRWVRLGEGRYELRPNDLSPFERDLMRVGDPNFQIDRADAISGSRRRDLALRLLKYLPPEGGAFGDLPEAERRELRAAFSTAVAHPVLQAQLWALPAALDNCILRAETSPLARPDGEPIVTIRLCAPDQKSRSGSVLNGRTLAWLGSSSLDEPREGSRTKPMH